MKSILTLAAPSKEICLSAPTYFSQANLPFGGIAILLGREAFFVRQDKERTAAIDHRGRSALCGKGKTVRSTPEAR